MGLNNQSCFSQFFSKCFSVWAVEKGNKLLMGHKTVFFLSWNRNQKKYFRICRLVKISNEFVNMVLTSCRRYRQWLWWRSKRWTKSTGIQRFSHWEYWLAKHIRRHEFEWTRSDHISKKYILLPAIKCYKFERSSSKINPNSEFIIRPKRLSSFDQSQRSFSINSWRAMFWLVER